MSDSPPTYIYKLIPSTAAPPTPLPSVLPVSELDAKSGFIHFSTSHQIPNTLRWFFADEPKVYILRVPYKPLEDAKVIRWEDPKAEVCGPRGGEGMFPHLYNGLKLGGQEVDSIQVLDKPAHGNWDEALKTISAWLEY